MARPRKFSDDQVLDAALAAVAAHGPDATVAQVAEALGGPTGSIYHRVESREELFVSLWLREIRRFQAGILELLASDAEVEEQLLGTALHIPRYCRAHRDSAVMMSLYRWRELRDDPPPRLADEVRGLNDEVMTGLAGLARRRYPRASAHRRAIVDTAVRQCPYGLVRPYLGRAVPAWLDDAVAASTTAILELGD